MIKICLNHEPIEPDNAKGKKYYTKNIVYREIFDGIHILLCIYLLTFQTNYLCIFIIFRSEK